MRKWMALTHMCNSLEHKKEGKMITITGDGDAVTLINVFGCDPQNQQHLIGLLDSSHGGNSWQASRYHFRRAASEQDGTRVVNYAQWKSAEDWENLFRVGSSSWFGDMGKYAKPDAHLYEVCYILDKSSEPER
jgi:hypothetical protein